MNDIRDSSPIDSIRGCQEIDGGTAGARRADELDLGRCELGTGRIDPCRPIESSFRNAVKGVISGSSQKQMQWVYAGWIVAAVKHIKPFWNKAVVDLPGNSMSKGGYLAHIQNPIPKAVSRLILPYPAIAWFHTALDLGKKAGFEIRSAVFPLASMATVLASAALEIAGIRSEELIALNACGGHRGI